VTCLLKLHQMRVLRVSYIYTHTQIYREFPSDISDSSELRALAFKAGERQLTIFTNIHVQVRVPYNNYLYLSIYRSIGIHITN